MDNPQTRTGIVFSLLAGASFLMLAMWILANAQLHEDAYMLFQYARQLSQGFGIAFDSVSGPSEGATDFLWMLLLSGFLWIGVDSGTASALMNAVALSVLGHVVFQIRGRVDAISLSVVIAMLLSGGVAASIGGFATLAFGALYGLLTLFALRRQLIPFMVLVVLISLFRPEGVLLASGTLVMYALRLSKDEVRIFSLCLVAVSVLGMMYFLGRYFYFELLLPLPLLVKQRTDVLLEGARQNLNAIKWYLPLIFFVLWRIRRVGVVNLLTVILGPTLLFIALVFVHQSQNIGLRFQFPIILSALFAFLLAAPSGPSWAVRFLSLLPVVSTVYGVPVIAQNIRYLTNDDYMNSFPLLLRERGFVVDNLASSEGGRLPFWYNAGRMLDLVGLNSPIVAVEGAYAGLEMNKPDLVLVHHAQQYILPENVDTASNFLELDPEDLTLKHYTGENPVYLAPGAALEYARQNGFRAILVKYGRGDTRYSHVYFISPALDSALFLEALGESFSTRFSYYESLTLYSVRSAQ